MHPANPSAVTSTAPSFPALVPNPGVIPSYGLASLHATALQDSQTQEQTVQATPSDWIRPGLGKGKRRRSGDLVDEDPPRPKKVKFSIAREPVELEG